MRERAPDAEADEHRVARHRRQQVSAFRRADRQRRGIRRREHEGADERRLVADRDALPEAARRDRKQREPREVHSVQRPQVVDAAAVAEIVAAEEHVLVDELRQLLADPRPAETVERERVRAAEGEKRGHFLGVRPVRSVIVDAERVAEGERRAERERGGGVRVRVAQRAPRRADADEDRDEDHRQIRERRVRHELVRGEHDRERVDVAAAAAARVLDTEQHGRPEQRERRQELHRRRAHVQEIRWQHRGEPDDERDVGPRVLPARAREQGRAQRPDESEDDRGHVQQPIDAVVGNREQPLHRAQRQRQRQRERGPERAIAILECGRGREVVVVARLVAEVVDEDAERRGIEIHERRIVVDPPHLARDRVREREDEEPAGEARHAAGLPCVACEEEQRRDQVDSGEDTMDPRRDLVLPPVASRVALADRYGVGPGEGTGDGGGSGHALHLLPLPTGVPPLAMHRSALRFTLGPLVTVMQSVSTSQRMVASLLHVPALMVSPGVGSPTQVPLVS